MDTSIPQPDWPYYKSEYDAGRLTQGAVAKALNITQGAVSRRFTKMDRATAGEPPSEPSSEPTAALQRVEYIGEPSGEPGLPDIARQSDLDNLNTRVEVLEAFIAIWQQQQTPIPGSPNGSPVVHPVYSGSPSGSPTHKRGFVMADDLFDAIHSYAAAHHLQVKDALDYLVRIGLSQVGQEVSGDA